MVKEINRTKVAGYTEAIDLELGGKLDKPIVAFGDNNYVEGAIVNAIDQL